MKNYYKILELTPDTEPSEIKKAYFRLIRKYPPDKEPKKFQEIREAYEYLQIEANREMLKEIYNLPSPFREVYSCAKEYEEKKDFVRAIKVCMDGLKIEPKQRELNIYAVRLYLKNEESGKAIKRLESLSGIFGEDITWNSLLAFAYAERGWVKKAFAQYKKAWLMGNQDVDFLSKYAFFCLENDYNEDSRKLIRLALVKEQEAEAHDSNRLIKVFSVLFAGDIFNTDFDFESDKVLYEELLNDSKLEAKEAKKVKLEVLESLISAYGKNSRRDEVLEYLLLTAQKENTTYSQKEKQSILDASCILEREKVNKDARLCEDMKTAAMEFYDRAVMLEEEYETYKKEVDLNILGAKLIIIDNLPKIRDELTIVKEEYPFLHEAMAEFLAELDKKESVAYIKNKYERKYCKLAGLPSNGHLIRNRADDRDFSFDEDFGLDGDFNFDEDFNFSQEPYKRETPKIGRNDPCPCGSGKKYKKCCGS